MLKKLEGEDRIGAHNILCKEIILMKYEDNRLAVSFFKKFFSSSELYYICRMINIGKAVVSEELLERKFICNIPACLGACCVEGDAGAPLEQEEVGILEEEIEKIKPYMVEKGVAAVDQIGTFDYDSDGDLVTPLVDNAECAYVYFEHGVALCAIEKAWEEGKLDWRKPISCHLYPVRITKYSGFEAVNYHRWHICEPAEQLGEEEGVPAYKFLKEPLTRQYGEDWYKELEGVAEAYYAEKASR